VRSWQLQLTLCLKCKIFDGSSWGSWEQIATGDSSSVEYFDAVAVNDDLHVVYQSADGNVLYRKRNATTGSWGTSLSITGNRNVQLAATESGEVYAVYEIGSDIRYRYYNGVSWGSENILCTGQTFTDTKAFNADEVVRDNKISIAYLSHTSSPYTVRHKVLSISDVQDNKVTVYDELDQKVICYYDGLGRAKTYERYNGSTLYSTERNTYNYLGLLKQTTMATGSVYKYDYSPLGDLVKTTNPDGSYSETIYNYNANTQETHDEMGRKKILTYNWDNLLTTVKEYYSANSFYQTDYTYDKTGNLLKIHDASAHETNYLYDQLNRVVQTKYADNTYVDSVYDKAGNADYRIERDGKFVDYTYDSLSRLVSTKHYSGAPFLSGWSYRKSINISGSTAGAQTNYTIRIRVYYGSGSDSPPNVYCSSNCRTDFGDIRFTKSDGTTLLDYWMAKKVDSSYADFWVEVDSIKTSPFSTGIFVYYGNAGVSTTSNGQNTFIAFDDFESYSDGATMPFGSFIVEATAENLEVDDTRSYSGTKSLWARDISGRNTRFKWDFSDISTSGYYRTHLSFYQQSGYSPINGFYAYNDQYPYAPCYMWRLYYSGIYGYSSGDWNSVTGYSYDSWHTIEICFAVVTSSYTDYFLDNTKFNDRVPASNLGNEYSYLSFDFMQSGETYNAWFDSLFISRYVDPEPAVSSFGSVVSSSSISNLEAIYTYDKVGNKKSTSYNGTTVSLSYDARNRLTKEKYNITNTNYAVEYSYNDVSSIVQVKYPDGYRLNSTYDGLNRLSALGYYATFTYTLNDKIDQINYGNNATTDYTYDSRSRPISIRVTSDGSTLLNCTYTYDASGSITHIRNSTSTETYGYDLLDRLTSSSGPWGSLTYTYDAVGNMLTKGAASYMYNNMNRLTTIGANDDYTYDLNGNLVGKEAGATTWAYVYDGADQLISASRNGTTMRRYGYDADGRRVRSYDGASGNMLYVYSGLNVLYEVPDGGGVATLRFYVGGQQLAERTNGTVTYLHQDHLGSTRLKTDSTGDRVFVSNYQPFGVDSGLSGSEEFRYTSKPSDDATGLYYFGARYYDPTIGRFITEDPHPGSLSDPQSLNRYVYCRNNPHKYTDPDGREPLTITALLFAMAAQGFISSAISTVSYTAANWDNRNDLSFREGLQQTMVTGFVAGALGGASGLIVSSCVSTAMATASPAIINSVQVGVNAFNVASKIGNAAVATATGLVARSSMSPLPKGTVEEAFTSTAISTSVSIATPGLYPPGNQYIDSILRQIQNTVTSSTLKSFVKDWITEQQRNED